MFLKVKKREEAKELWKDRIVTLWENPAKRQTWLDFSPIL